MSYFANVVDGVVEQVISAEKDFVDTLGGTWLQTSYNTSGGVHYGQDGQPDGGIALRKNYASVGGIYDEGLDAFMRTQPYASWILDEDTCWWNPPTPYPQPDNGVNEYLWDEDTLSWVEYE
jgi:hypothetical protein